jgi:hypothetical protein
MRERSLRNVSSIRKELRMKLITQRIMMAAAALSLSALIAGCGARSANPSTETFTVYQDAPKMSLFDLGAPGNSLGDVYHFSAPLHSERGGPVTGEVIGSKTLVKVATGADPNLERRATLLFFTFADRKDRMLTNLSSVRFQWNRQLHGCAWPGHQHPGCGWFVYASIHVIEVIGTEFKDV